MTVFGDWESITVTDPDHSEEEERYLIIGRSSRNRMLVVSHTERGRMSALSARGEQMRENDVNMASKARDEMRDHYDFSRGVRGKYAARYAEGENVVVLAPDVAEIFPDSVAVNEALRTLVRISNKTIRTKTSSRKRGG
jgi:uncharacterized DUF497 family protein